MRPLIEIHNVSRSYDAHVAVRDLGLAVPAGEFVAIIGPSGCGKTTTLKMINRLIEPDAGEIFIAGEPTHSLPAHLLRRRIGYVFQGIGLFPHLTVAGNIGITPQLLGWAREKIAARVTELLGDTTPFLLRLAQTIAWTEGRVQADLRTQRLQPRTLAPSRVETVNDVLRGRPSLLRLIARSASTRHARSFVARRRAQAPLAGA
jgi:ABC-type Fe3+/spermidine/putrescine transport system ATPase subunit